MHGIFYVSLTRTHNTAVFNQLTLYSCLPFTWSTSFQQDREDIGVVSSNTVKFFQDRLCSTMDCLTQSYLTRFRRLCYLWYFIAYEAFASKLICRLLLVQ